MVAKFQSHGKHNVRLSLPCASADGRRIAFSRRADDGKHLALLDQDSKKLEPIAVEGAREPALSPAGDKIAFMRVGDLALYELSTKKETVLSATGDDFEIRYPKFALDGRRVYFEVRTKDPVFPKYRNISAVASVPVQ